MTNNVSSNFKIFKSEPEFHHDWLDTPSLERIDSPDGRKYRTPSGNLYDSVTTVLGRGPKPEIDQWRNAVGAEKADRVSKHATNRGTALHDRIENYLLNHTVHVPKTDFLGCDLMTRISPHLNYISDIQALEDSLYSDKLKLAGTVDCIGKWQGIPSIIDFKTSTKIKDRESIDSYFMQTAIYSMMAQELFNLSFKQLVIIIAVEFSPVQIFVCPRKLWIPKTLEFLTTN